MSHPASAAVGRFARVLDPDPPADADLVGRFAAGRDEEAFAELVRRHGPTVLGVCRRRLGCSADADDAFQAVFLVLARKAHAVRPPGRVGAWLYAVAVRTCQKAKVMAARRRRHETASGGRKLAVDSPDWSDLAPVLDAELARLPADLRAVVVLCDLNGKTRTAAARDLGWPEGTVAARLARARSLLAARLSRRGVTLSAAGLAAALAAPAATAAVPPALFAAVTCPAVPPSVHLLADGVIRTMLLSSWKVWAAVVVAVGGLAGGTAVVAGGGSSTRPVAAVVAPPPKADPPAEKERNQDLWVWQESERLGRRGPNQFGTGVRAVAFSPDGKMFFTASADGTAAGWEAPTARVQWRLTQDGTAGNPRPAVAVSADGKQVAVCLARGVAIFEAASGRLEQSIADVGPFAAVAFSPVATRVAITDGRKLRAIGYDRGGGEASFGPLAGVDQLQGDLPAAVAWSPDGKRVVFLPNAKIDPTWPGNGDTNPDPKKATHYYAQVWGAGSGEAMQMLKHGPDPLTAVAWSPNGKRILTADEKGVVVVWDGEAFKELKRLKADGPVTALAFAANSKRFAAGVRRKPEKDGAADAVRVVVWTEQEGSNPDNWLSSSTISLPTAERVTSLAFSPDGKALAAASESADGRGGGLRLWDRVKVAPK